VQISIDAQEKHTGNHSLRLTFDGKSIVIHGNLSLRSGAAADLLPFFGVGENEGGHNGSRRPIPAGLLGTEDTSVAVTPDVHA